MKFLWRCGLCWIACSLFPFLTMANEPAPASKHVALIFDDGPVPAQAEAFRELFAQEQVRVTWAYVAREVQQHPELARAAQAAGHEVANHSFSHQHARQIDDEALRTEIVAAQHVFTATLDVAPAWYWKPFAESDPRQAALWQEAGIRDFGFTPQVWSNDWDRGQTAEQIFAAATTGVVDGSLIIFHEWREETLAQMPAILAELRRQGCTFLTISELARYWEAKSANE